MSSVRTLALSALMLVGFAGISAAQSTTVPQTRADSGFHRRGPRGGEMGARKGGREFGADLNLTDAQKAQIKTIRAKYKPQNEALRTQAKPYMDAAKAARQKGDTVAFRTNIEKARQVMQGGQSYRTQENAEIRAILTPAQQAKFDAREKAMADRRANGGKGGWGKKGLRTKPAKQ
ncbi:MAG: Spy/CpxP family protein refolding chaperone [Gemmatimonadales bacterium]